MLIHSTRFNHGSGYYVIIGDWTFYPWHVILASVFYETVCIHELVAVSIRT